MNTETKHLSLPQSQINSSRLTPWFQEKNGLSSLEQDLLFRNWLSFPTTFLMNANYKNKNSLEYCVYICGRGEGGGGCQDNLEKFLHLYITIKRSKI